MHDELVYVIRRGSSYKIGRTRDLPNRLKSLRPGWSEPIVVVFQFKTTDSCGLERYLHRLVGHVRRSGGEWFYLRGYPEIELAKTYDFLEHWRTPHEERSAPRCPRKSRPERRIPPI
jgi:hypothetical protein